MIVKKIEFNKLAWKEVKTPFEKPKFVTHSNYLGFMSENSVNLSLACNLNIEKQIASPKILINKKGLLKLTLENLNAEKKSIEKYPEYAIVCVSWMPVKTYYLIFNLLLILDYLITGNEESLTTTHTAVSKKLKHLLGEEILLFNKDLFNKIYEVEDIESWKILPWENIKRKDANPDIRKKQIVKKLLEYKKEEYKRKREENFFF